VYLFLIGKWDDHRWRPKVELKKRHVSVVFFNEEIAPQRFDRDRVLFRTLTNVGAL